MKKIFLAIVLSILPALVLAAQTPVTTIDKFNSATTTINTLREATNTKLGVIESNRQDHVTNIAGKADKSATVMLWSEWADGVSFTTTSPPVAYNGALYKCVAPYTKVAGETPDTQTGYFAEVTGSGWTGDIEGVTAGTGLSGGGTSGSVTLSADTTYLQRRVSSTCSAGSSIREIATDGTVTCEIDDTGSGSVPAGTVNGQVLIWTTDQWVASTAPWLTTASLGTGVATALGFAPDTAGGFLAYSTYAADPLIAWDSATITETVNSPTAGTNTISVKAGVFQAYDANMILWPSTISTTEVGYLNGLTEALSTSLSGKQETLVSGTNIKTVNNVTLLGSGNITVEGSTPTVQADDPTSASAAGWYAATGSGDIFYKSDDGLFTIAGSYVADPAGYTLTIDGTGWNDIDLISVGGSTYTADGTKTGLSGVVSITVTPDTGREATCSGTRITGSASPYSFDASGDSILSCTFSDAITSETIGNNINGASMLPNTGDLIYFYPVDAQFATTGTLASYTMTARQQTGVRTISAGLYIYSGGIMTLVEGSTTGNILYTASVDQTDITLTPTGSAIVSAGVTYYVGVFPNGYAAVYGTTTGGTAYSAVELDGVLASSYGSLAGTTGVPGKWRITKN